MSEPIPESEYWKLRREHEAEKRAEFEQLEEWDAGIDLELLGAFVTAHMDAHPEKWEKVYRDGVRVGYFAAKDSKSPQ